MEEELKQRMEFQCAGGSVVVVSSEKIIMSRNQYGTYCTLMCNHNIVMPFSSVPRCFWRHFHNAGYLLTGHTLSAHLAPPLAPPHHLAPSSSPALPLLDRPTTSHHHFTSAYIVNSTRRGKEIGIEIEERE